MYRLRHFKEIYGKCCVENPVSFTFTNYSIYDFHPLSVQNFITNVIGLFTPCETIYLNWLYWYVLILSIVKVVSHCINNFTHKDSFHFISSIPYAKYMLPSDKQESYIYFEIDSCTMCPFKRD